MSSLIIPSLPKCCFVPVKIRYKKCYSPHIRKADFKAIRVALLKCSPYNLPVEIEENVVKLFEKKEASGHALTTRDGVALACAAAHLVCIVTFTKWCLDNFGLLLQLWPSYQHCFYYILNLILSEAWKSKKYQLKVLLGNFQVLPRSVLLRKKLS